MSKIRSLLNLLVILSVITAFIGVIILIWTGLFGLKIVATGVTLTVCFTFFYDMAKSIEKEKSNDII